VSTSKASRLLCTWMTHTTRLVDTLTLPMMLKLVMSGERWPGKLAAHHFNLKEMMKAYDDFRQAARESAEGYFAQQVNPALELSGVHHPFTHAA
jgi:hypothetical protein